jgi:hypothetical protein
MKYRVFWSPEAERQFESILTDRYVYDQAVEAARDIDAVLMNDPLGFGESRTETIRVGFIRPLDVQYDVLTDVQTVVVEDVWRIDQRRYPFNRSVRQVKLSCRL